MRWHVAVVQSWSQRSQRSRSKQPPAAYYITHSSTRARLSSSFFRTCLFSGHPFPSVAVCRTDPHRHPSQPFSESGGRRFSCSISCSPRFLFMEAGEVPAVPEQQLRPPHRSRWQNEVAVVRWQGLSTYPSRHGTCLSVSPYGRHARRGSLWCPFPAVVRPSWSTEF